MHLAALLVLIAAPVVVAAVQVAPAPPPTVVQVQQWFEAGQYDDVTEAAPAVDDPKARYLAAASFERLGRMDQARQAYTQLSLSGARDPWAMIGRSAQALSTVSPTAAALPARAPDAEKILAAAEQSAQRAVQLATPAPSKAAADAAPAEAPPHPALAIAHYQLGLVQAHRDNVEDAAASFGRAVTADPSFAYAHYYAGLMYSRLQREDQATVYWEAFLNLAPKAPEAPQVQTLMPALRAR
jgi:tetratricopeptide (TPR) repeat protein